MVWGVDHSTSPQSKIPQETGEDRIQRTGKERSDADGKNYRREKRNLQEFLPDGLKYFSKIKCNVIC